MLAAAILAVSLLALVKSSGYFVEAAARLAKRFGISELVIGLTIIAVGTTIPELTSSVLASAHGYTSLAVGTVVGSNIANIGLVLGFSALMVTVKVDRERLARGCTVMLGASLMFWFFAGDGTVSFAEGAVLFSLVPFYFAFLFSYRPHPRKLTRELTGYLVTYVSGFRRLSGLHKAGTYRRLFKASAYGRLTSDGPSRDISLMFVMGFCIALSAEYAVRSASHLAALLGIAQGVIGATVIAVGTSLPELSVAVSATRKGYPGIMLGNLIGANILNVLQVAGIAAIVSPLTVLPATLTISIPFMALFAVALFALVKSGRTINRAAGAGLLALYALFLYLLISGGAILPHGIS